AVPSLLLAALIQEREYANMALRESEERFHTLADAAPVLIWMAGADQSYTYFNRGWLAFTGRTLEQERGGGWTQGIHPEDRERCLSWCSSAWSRREDFSLQYRLRRGDGRYRWIWGTAIPRHAPDGEFLGYIGASVDVTERKEAEEALRASEEQYRDLVETQTDLICRYRPDATLTFVNDAYCRYFGKSRQELIGTKFTSFIPSSAAARSRANLKRFLADPHVVTDEHDVVLPNGRRGWQQWVAHAIFDSVGNVSEIQAIGRDLTERKQAEEALRESEERFRAFFELTAVGAVEADPTTGRFLRVNAALRQITGYTKKELLQLGFKDLIHPEDREQEFLVFRRYVLAAISSWRQEIRFVRRDGRTIWVQEEVSLVHDRPDRPARAVANIKDIPERHRTHEALEYLSAELLRAQDEERRRISHDLHDGTAQTVVGITLNLANLRGLLSSDVRERDQAEHLL